MGTPTRRKAHLLLLVAVVLVSSPARSSPRGSPATFGPVFEDQPLGLLFPEESTEEKVTLACRARASPPATYRWKMNGTEMKLAPGSRHQLVGGNLVILNPSKAQDAGVYQCLASNPVGTVVSREAVLRFGFLQEFSKEERDPVKTHEGWGVMLPCNPPAHYPGLSYRWLLNEFPNFIPTDGRHFVSQTTGNLYIARTNASDLGNYSCLATSHMDFSTKSVFSKFAQLNLAAEDTRLFAPSIKARFPAETYALVGQQVTLECFAFGNPVPQIKWRKVDGSLSPQWATAEPTLQIPSISFEDEGTYECEAENSKGRDTVQGRIIVQAQPEWLKVISDMEADIGSNLRWGCAAAGKPRPTVRWLRNGEPLTSQSRVEVLAGDLRFSKLSLEDSGMYQCVAENKHGTIYASAELAVQALAPDFRLNPVKRLIPAARGGEIAIPCQPRAAPKAVVLWSKGTEILVNSSRVTVTPDGTLIIRNISRSDEGKYTCFAENFMGKANSTGILSVRDATKITLAPSSADINLGDSLTLQCHASHDPTMDLTFIWTLDDFPIDFDKPGGHYRRASAKETVGDLTILNAQLRHGGKYTCMAQTVVDSASKEATVLVRGPPRSPRRRSGEEHWRHHRPAQLEPRLRQPQPHCQVHPASPHSTCREVEAGSDQSRQHRGQRRDCPGAGPHALDGLRVPGRSQQHPGHLGSPAGPLAKSGPRKQPPQWRPQDSAEGVEPLESSSSTGRPCPGSTRTETASATCCPSAGRAAPAGRPPGCPAPTPSTSSTATTACGPTRPSRSRSAATTAAGTGPRASRRWCTRRRKIRYWKAGDKEAAADRVRTAGLDTSARVTGLHPNTKYHVTIRAYNRAGTGPTSPSANATTMKPPPQRPPDNISWTFSSSTLSIKWDPVVPFRNESAVTGYKMLYQNDLHPTPTLHLTSRNWIDIAVPEDIGHALVQIRTTGPGGDGIPAEVHIVRNGGTSMMVENSAVSPAPHPSAILSPPVVMLLLAGYLGL
uniref:Contactin-2 n=1 Tax=Canis lupus familiaris TaxID=9615 RepID=A0A8C0RH19_CANLF